MQIKKLFLYYSVSAVFLLSASGSDNANADKTNVINNPNGALNKIRVIETNSDSDTAASGNNVPTGDVMPANVTTLRLSKIAGYEGEKITIEAVYNAYLYDPLTNISWEIVDVDGNIVASQEGGNHFNWTPGESSAGNYVLSFNQTFAEREIIATENLYVLEKPAQDQDLTERFWQMNENLLGTWVGQSVAPYNKSAISLVFNADNSLQIEQFNQDLYFMDPYRFITPGPAPEPYPIIPGRFPKPMFDTQFGLIKQEGNYELLDIWANGEAEGILTMANYPSPGFSNFRRIRFSSDNSMLFF